MKNPRACAVLPSFFPWGFPPFSIFFLFFSCLSCKLDKNQRAGLVLTGDQPGKGLKAPEWRLMKFGCVMLVFLLVFLSNPPKWDINYGQTESLLIGCSLGHRRLPYLNVLKPRFASCMPERTLDLSPLGGKIWNPVPYCQRDSSVLCSARPERTF